MPKRKKSTKAAPVAPVVVTSKNPILIAFSICSLLLLGLFGMGRIFAVSGLSIEGEDAIVSTLADTALCEEDGVSFMQFGSRKCQALVVIAATPEPTAEPTPEPTAEPEETPEPEPDPPGDGDSIFDQPHVRKAFSEVNDAGSVEEISATMTEFTKYYGVAWDFNGVRTASQMGVGGRTGTITNNDLKLYRGFSVSTIREFAKYTPTYVGRMGLRNMGVIRAIFGQNGQQTSYVGLAMGDTYLVVISYGDSPTTSSTMHHELEHVGDYAMFQGGGGWSQLNPPGFRYQGVVRANGANNFPFPGFVSEYSYYVSATEDRAETYAFMLTTEYWDRMQQVVKSDTLLKGKYDYVLRGIAKLDPTYTEERLSQIHADYKQNAAAASRLLGEGYLEDMCADYEGDPDFTPAICLPNPDEGFFYFPHDAELRPPGFDDVPVDDQDFHDDGA